MSCQKLVSCSAVHSASDDSVQTRIVVSGDPQHEPAHRIGGSAAVIEHVGPRLVAVRRDILTKRAEQILEERHRKVARANRLSNREKYLIGRIALVGPHARVQPLFPIIQQSQAFGGRPAALVGKIIGGARKGVHRGHVGTHGAGQQPRRHRKIFVMRARHPLARRVGRRQIRQASYVTGDFPCGT